MYMVLWQVREWLPSPAWVMIWQWRFLTGLEVKREAENELMWQLIHGNVMKPYLSPFTKGWYWLSVIGVILLTIVRYVGWLTKCIWQINTRGDNDGGANHLFLTSQPEEVNEAWPFTQRVVCKNKHSDVLQTCLPGHYFPFIDDG